MLCATIWTLERRSRSGFEHRRLPAIEPLKRLILKDRALSGPFHPVDSSVACDYRLCFVVGAGVWLGRSPLSHQKPKWMRVFITFRSAFGSLTTRRVRADRGDRLCAGLRNCSRRSARLAKIVIARLARWVLGPCMVLSRRDWLCRPSPIGHPIKRTRGWRVLLIQASLSVWDAGVVRTSGFGAVGETEVPPGAAGSWGPGAGGCGPWPVAGSQ